MTSRSLLALLVVLSLALFAGCYASTQPATNVKPESATLRAEGTANKGPASSWFEYWLTGAPDRKKLTAQQHFPAGASGPYSQPVTGLAAGSGYSFRVCGGEDGSNPRSCAQTVTFTTPAPTEDSAVGSASSGCCHFWSFDAHSGPGGESPRGTMTYSDTSAFVPATFFNGTVTCLAVDGRAAAIGAVGELRRVGSPDDTPQQASLLATVVDGHLNADTTGSRIFGPASPQPDCGGASFAGQQQFGDYVVNDARP